MALTKGQRRARDKTRQRAALRALPDSAYKRDMLWCCAVFDRYDNQPRDMAKMRANVKARKSNPPAKRRTAA